MGTKKGHKKYIETPEKMWEHFDQYRKETKSNPIKQHDFIGGKDLHEVHREKERPLTLSGFSAWLYEKGITSNAMEYFVNSKGIYDDYSSICRTIKEIIRNDQIEGGMAGIYNPSITQRLNGLTDKSEVTHVEQPLFGEDDDK